MEMALGAAIWLLSKVLKKLSDDLVAGYVASTELGPNIDKIKTELMYTLGLLHESQGKNDVRDNPGLQLLLENLSKKADEAEDALDELHYFMIQDDLDGTDDAKSHLGSVTLHVSHGVRHATGNWRSYFCFCCTREVADAAVVVNNPRNTNNSQPENDFDGHVERLPFNRADMSNKIKLIIEEIQSLCNPISNLLQIHPSSSLPGRMADTLKRQIIGSTITQDKLYGRATIFDQTIKDMTSGMHQETLSVLPIVGPGGIGKTTFTQHLYNDKRIKQYFTVRFWLCLSSNFDVLTLTKEILSCILAEENEGSNRAIETNNLDQLQISIAQKIKFKRFLIVLDDMWKCSEDKWERLLAPFRKGEAENGSMILVTTRLPYISQMVKTSNHVNLRGLEPNDFWEFFQACVFGEVIDRHDKDHLTDIARQIANKLKCSPLAAKTVGRLLKKKPSRERWIEILENKEWLNQKHEDDIMPALKISYDYLPFYLKKCFSYFSLFPEDHKFDKLEITNFWIAIGIIDFSGQNDNSYLEELEDSGFLLKGDNSSHQYYVMHDLLHELSQIVSSQECLNISQPTFRANATPPSIRHISFTMQDICDEYFMKEMDDLKRKIDIGKLRSLMFFGEYYSVSIGNALKDIFKEVKGLRVLFIHIDSPRSLPDNFSKLIHLRYLKIGSPSYSDMNLPRTIYRFYHLKFLNIEHWRAKKNLHQDIRHLVNLHRLIAKNEFYSNVPEVGKMKCLLELKEFHVNKRDVGFELRELGNLELLGGELSIRGLENVRTREEAAEAKLVNKRNLHKLRLVWPSREQLALSPKQRQIKKSALEPDVLDGLRPHPNIRRLCIINHSSSCGPNWLCREIGITKLESLHLEGVSWDTFPPFGQMPYLRKLKLRNIAGMHQFGPDFGGDADRSFTNLKMIVFDEMPELTTWVPDTNHQLFSGLESVKCVGCPNLASLPFLKCSGPSIQDTNTTWYPNLSSVWIERCNKLFLPPMPYSSTLNYLRVQQDRNKGLFYEKKLLKVLQYTGYLAFRNLDKVEKMEIKDFSNMSLSHLGKLNSLSSLHVYESNAIFSGQVDNRIILHSIRRLHLERFCPTTESLSKLFNYFQALSELWIEGSSGDNGCVLVLQLPSSDSLQKFEISKCNGLFLSVEDGGLRNHTLLQSLKLSECGHMFSRWPIGEAAETIKPFPTSLRELVIVQQPSLHSMALLSNLTSLTKLVLAHCDNLTIDGFNPQITFNLKHLEVHNSSGRFKSPCASIAADILTEVARAEPTMPAGAFQLEHLVVDDISSVLVAPICSRLSSTLRFLTFKHDLRAEGFTKKQVQALQHLTTLQSLQFKSCQMLQTLPRGLHRLCSLKEIVIDDCHKIRSLPIGGLPSWMELIASGCSNELLEQLSKHSAKNRI